MVILIKAVNGKQNGGFIVKRINSYNQREAIGRELAVWSKMISLHTRNSVEACQVMNLIPCKLLVCLTKERALSEMHSISHKLLVRVY
jgi:hypothetical protein